MDIPIATLLNSIEEKNIYLFTPNANIGIGGHMHICLKNPTGRLLYFVVCTTKRETILRFLDKQGISYSTLVGIPKDEVNSLDDDTYINCNNVEECSETDFLNSYNNGDISYIGKINSEIYQLIIEGIHTSPVIETNIKKMIA